MRTLTLSGLAATLAALASLSSPASAQSYARHQQPSYGGHQNYGQEMRKSPGYLTGMGPTANTYGGNNQNYANGKNAQAMQQVTTIGGEARGGKGYGGHEQKGYGGHEQKGYGYGQDMRKVPGYTTGMGPTANTYGGNNQNWANGKNAYAQQDVTTVGGQAIGGGRRGYGPTANTYGGNNQNYANGKNSQATQTVTTIGGTAGR